MNPFLSSPMERIRAWRNFRDTLKTCDNIKQLELVQYWFDQCPIIERQLDWDNIINWPNPWELLYYGNICIAGKAYLMKESLLLVDKASWQHRLNIAILDNKKELDMTVVLLADNYILNYSHNELVKLKDIDNDINLVVVDK